MAQICLHRTSSSRSKAGHIYRCFEHAGELLADNKAEFITWRAPAYWSWVEIDPATTDPMDLLLVQQETLTSAAASAPSAAACALALTSAAAGGLLGQQPALQDLTAKIDALEARVHRADERANNAEKRVEDLEDLLKVLRVEFEEFKDPAR